MSTRGALERNVTALRRVTREVRMPGIRRIPPPSIPILLTVFLTSTVSGLEKRQPLDIPLPDLTVSFDADSRLREVFVMFGASDEGWAVSDGDDRYVKDTPRQRTDHAYRELPSQKHLISSFEAMVLGKVCKPFAETLDIYERDLHGRRWERLRYLDGRFPAFFRGFYFLVNAAKNSREALPRTTLVADSLYDNPSKSDARIRAWRYDQALQLKLRIAATELALRLRSWQAKVLDNPRRDPLNDNLGAVAEAYRLFVLLYFNLMAAP